MSSSPSSITNLTHNQNGTLQQQLTDGTLRDPKLMMRETEEQKRMHSTMAMILLFCLFGSQFLIMYWREKHPSSYNMVSLGGLWLIPMMMGLNAGNHRYVFIWTLFSITTGVIVRKALSSPMKKETPGLVYGWFAGVYSVSYWVGLLGYLLVCLSILRIPEIFFGVSEVGEESLFKIGLIVLFYGLYFGVLGRDIIDRLSDTMATSLGYYSKTGFPTKHLRPNVCAICGGRTDNASIIQLNNHRSDQNVREGTSSLSGHFSSIAFSSKANEAYQLDCQHIYHDKCIRGWTLIGKKDCCPYCKEKVDLRAFKGKNPWETSQELYLNLLDACRYVLVWNPIVLLLVQLIFKIFGLH